MSVSLTSDQLNQFVPDPTPQRLLEIRNLSKDAVFNGIVDFRKKIALLKKSDINIDKIIFDLKQKDKAILNHEFYLLEQVYNDIVKSNTNETAPAEVESQGDKTNEKREEVPADTGREIQVGTPKRKGRRKTT